jgi:hypothetical protein
VVSVTLRPGFTPAKGPWYPLDRRLGVLQNRSGHKRLKESSFATDGDRTLVVQSVVRRYIDWAILDYSELYLCFHDGIWLPPKKVTYENRSRLVFENHSSRMWVEQLLVRGFRDFVVSQSECQNITLTRISRLFPNPYTYFLICDRIWRWVRMQIFVKKEICLSNEWHSHRPARSYFIYWWSYLTS